MRFKVYGQFLVPAVVEVEAEDSLDAQNKAEDPSNWLDTEEYARPAE